MTPIFESDIEQFVIELLQNQNFDCFLPKLMKEETRVKKVIKLEDRLDG